MTQISVCVPFPGGIGAVSYADAVRRVQAYCCARGSGWATYDLPGIAARRTGTFKSVTPWSILNANALSARVSQTQVADFDLIARREFARRVSRIPDQTPLSDLDAQQRTRVVELASFGFRGAWGPTITKLAALYRPDAIPVLDAQMAIAFGLKAHAFRTNERHGHIARVVEALAEWLGCEEGREILGAVRTEVSKTVEELDLLSDVRLLDIIIWTSQDDRSSRRRGKSRRWADIEASEVQVRLASAEAIIIDEHPLGSDTKSPGEEGALCRRKI
jgi:hypothetical protein